MIPLVLRYPECGYKASWGGGLYSLERRRVHRRRRSGEAVFPRPRRAGEVSEFELPTEISHLECFEGRNWYNVFDDPDYDERYYACLDAGFAG